MNLKKALLPFALVSALPLTAAADKMMGAARIELVPMGSVKVEGVEETGSLGFTFGFGAAGYYEVAPNIHVGLAPRYVLGLKDKDAPDGSDSASEIDIPVKALYTYPVNPQISVYGALSFGYSLISIPDKPDGVDGPSGFVLGFGAGGMYGINDKLFATAELGYSLGLQKVSAGGESADFKISLLSLGLGIGSKF